MLATEVFVGGEGTFSPPPISPCLPEGCPCAPEELPPIPPDPAPIAAELPPPTESVPPSGEDAPSVVVEVDPPVEAVAFPQERSTDLSVSYSPAERVFAVVKSGFPVGVDEPGRPALKFSSDGHRTGQQVGLESWRWRGAEER